MGHDQAWVQRTSECHQSLDSMGIYQFQWSWGKDVPSKECTDSGQSIPTLCLIPLRPTGPHLILEMGPWKGTLVFWGSPLTLSMGALRASMSSQWLPMVLSSGSCFSLCVLLFCNSSIQKSEQHQIWPEDSPVEYDKRTGIRAVTPLLLKVRFCLYFKTFYFVQYEFGGITFLKIFHKILFTLITEFNWIPLSLVLGGACLTCISLVPCFDPCFLIKV